LNLVRLGSDIRKGKAWIGSRECEIRHSSSGIGAL